jgi:hypothetical protein
MACFDRLATVLVAAATPADDGDHLNADEAAAVTEAAEYLFDRDRLIFTVLALLASNKLLFAAMLERHGECDDPDCFLRSPDALAAAMRQPVNDAVNVAVLLSALDGG